jgi:hypothetical protein
MHGEARLKKPVPVMWSGRTGERERALGALSASSLPRHVEWSDW